MIASVHVNKITGNKKIKTLEREFQTVFGLYAQVCYRPQGRPAGKGYVTNEDQDEYTLTSFKEYCKKSGFEVYQY